MLPNRAAKAWTWAMEVRAKAHPPKKKPKGHRQGATHDISCQGAREEASNGNDMPMSPPPKKKKPGMGNARASSSQEEALSA